jgi:drug/metabolite transporter (DMT)-like permease
MSDNSKTPAILLMIVLSLIWGSSFILIKQGLKVFSADQVGALRVSSAFLFLLPLAFSRLKELKTHHYVSLFFSGMLGIFVPAFLFSFAQTHMSSSVAGIMNTLTPMFTMVIGVLLFSQRFRTIAILGIVLGFGGAILLILSREEGQITGINYYALLIVLACLCYGMNLNYIKFKIADLSALTITSISVVLIGPFALIYLVGFTDFTTQVQTAPGGWKAFGFVALLGTMGTAIATVLFNRLVKISTPLFASSVTYIIPIVAVMWGVLDNEKLVAGHFIGMIAIVGGVYLANRRGK